MASDGPRKPTLARAALRTGGSSEHVDTPVEQAARKLARLHGLGEQKALDQIESQFAHRQQIGAHLHARGDGAHAEPPRKVDDGGAERVLQPILRTTMDELAVDLE